MTSEYWQWGGIQPYIIGSITQPREIASALVRPQSVIRGFDPIHGPVGTWRGRKDPITVPIPIEKMIARMSSPYFVLGLLLGVDGKSFSSWLSIDGSRLDTGAYSRSLKVMTKGTSWVKKCQFRDYGRGRSWSVTGIQETQTKEEKLHRPTTITRSNGHRMNLKRAT